MTALNSPDASSVGLLETAPDPHRYDWNGVFGEDGKGEVPAIISRWLPNDASVLDVGCGGGAVGVLINRGRVGPYLGLEPDQDRAAAARDRGLDVISTYLDDAFLAERGPFDAMLFTDVLEHLPAPGEMVALAVRGLKPGGCIIASVPNVAHWTVRARLLFGRFDYQSSGIMDATHLRWFTRRSFVALFEKQGLRVVAQDVSEGQWLGEYSKLPPFSLLPPGLRRRLVSGLTRAFPGLFGCQVVVMAIAP